MSKTMEPYLMSVLSSRLYSIGLEMTNTLMRTARSQLMSVCHDLSTAICDRNGKVIALAESIPVHCANMGLTVSPCFSHPDGIQPGDLFLNNSPYHGNTHHADYTYIAPVFNEGELMFFAVTKGHQADIGNAIPSTYAPTARDMFEEGAIDWPCIKIQRDYKDVADIIKIAQMHNRVPEMWYGDYLACVGSSRVGEKRLAALCAEYGNEKIKYIAAVSVSVTFIVVMVFLGPLFGYAAMFYGVSFWLHGVVPLCAIFEFLFCNRTKFSQKDSLLAALPMMIYGLFYVGNILINGVGEWPHSNDWYGFMSWGYPIGFAIYFFISLATWAFALFLKKANEAIIKRI